MFSQYFIDKPRFAGVISIILILLGVLAIAVLPVSQYPEITPPQIIVSTVYAGANAKVLVDTVAVPIENQINGVENMLYMNSTSDDNGTYTLTITFDIGTDPDIAQVKVENRLQQAMPDLPAIVVTEGVDVKTQSPNMLGMLVLRSPDLSYNDLYLSNYAYDNIKNPLSRIKGLGDVTVYGPQYSMRVWLNTRKISSLGLNSTDIVKVIENQNTQASIGEIGGSPSPKDTALVLTLSAKGLLSSVEDFEEIVVATSKNGGIVRLKDVARVELGADSYNVEAGFDNTPAVVIMLSQSPNSNSLDIMKSVEEAIVELSEDLPEDMELSVAYDSTKFVKASIYNILETLVITFLLVVLVTYLFLQKVKTTLIPLITIPVSLIATFAVIYLIGFDINILTLFAMILAIGLVVDDAIIVVERVEYLMSVEGLSSKEAASKAMKQIAGAVIATTFVLLSIFVPVALMAGITGKIYQQFAVTIATAVVISSFNALTLSPTLCAIFLRGDKKTEPKGFFKWFDAIIDYMKNKYLIFVRYFSKHIIITAGVIIGVMGLIAFLFQTTPSSFLPEEDQGMIFANLQLGETATINQTNQVLAEMGETIMETEGVDYFISVAGYSMLGGGGENVALGVIGLKDWEQRETPNLSLESINTKLTKDFANNSSAQIQFFAPPSIPGIGNADGLSFELLADDGAITPNQLFANMDKFLGALDGSDEMAYAFTTFAADTPHVYLDIDRTKLESYNIPVGNLFASLQNNLGSRYINNITLSGQVNKVIIQADFPYREDIDDVRNLHVRSTTGDLIKIKSFATISTVVSPKTIYRYNQYVCYYVYVNNVPIQRKCK